MPGSSTDPSRPAARMGTAGLRGDVVVDAQGGAPAERRIPRSQKLVVLATGEDPETGLRQLTIHGNVSLFCLPPSPLVGETVFETARADAATTVELIKSYTLDVPGLRARCGVGQFRELRADLWVEALNGAGQTAASGHLVLRAYGPDRIRVATFNLHQPGNHADDVYQRWGAELASRADIVLLTEVADLRRARLIADTAGMPHVVTYRDQSSDVAIVSRGALQVVARNVIDPPGRLTSNDSVILAATVTLDNYSMVLVATHWGIRGANDELFEPWRSSPSRSEAADKILSLLQSNPASTVIVGGDLNAYSGVGPQLAGHETASTAEVDKLRQTFVDPFSATNSPNDAHCSNQRIDYVLIRSDYAATSYEGCFPQATPSDHPFVLATFEVQ